MENFLGFETSLFVFVKIGIWLFLFLYIIFSGIVIRQVRAMTETIQVGFEKAVKFLAFAHFAASVFIFILALIIL